MISAAARDDIENIGADMVAEIERDVIGIVARAACRTHYQRAAMAAGMRHCASALAVLSDDEAAADQALNIERKHRRRAQQQAHKTRRGIL